MCSIWWEDAYTKSNGVESNGMNRFICLYRLDLLMFNWWEMTFLKHVDEFVTNFTHFLNVGLFCHVIKLETYVPFLGKSYPSIIKRLIFESINGKIALDSAQMKIVHNVRLLEESRWLLNLEYLLGDFGPVPLSQP